MLQRDIVCAVFSSGDIFMTRKIIKSLALALIAVFALASVSEAAPRKVRHRPKHSTRQPIRAVFPSN